MALHHTGRLFLAIWPQRHSSEQLYPLGPLHVPSGNRQHPADLHLTLLYLGPVAATLQARLLAEIVQCCNTQPHFTLTLDRLGYWSGPRIAWLAPTRPPAGLCALEAALRERVAPLCKLQAAHPYKPHLTLYREAPGVRTRSVPPVTLQVQHCVLARGTPNAIPRYQQLMTFALQARAP